MGSYCETETHKFMDSDGELKDHECTYVGGEKLKQFLKDMYGPGGRNYAEPAVNLSLDSGQGKFLVCSSGWDKSRMGDPTGTFPLNMYFIAILKANLRSHIILKHVLTHQSEKSFRSNSFPWLMSVQLWSWLFCSSSPFAPLVVI